MIQYFSADLIFPVNGVPIRKGVIAVRDGGMVEAVYTAAEAETLGLENIQFYAGAIVPGFVNTHCHLELSHLLGKIPRHTGLIGFVQHVMRQRESEPRDIEQAMQQADREMYANGIVAVGDISNKPVSKKVKEESRIDYHTFVEAMGFNPARAEAALAHAREVLAQFKPLKATIVPHAPYSVSEALFEGICDQALDTDILSIHNQETADENAFFEDKAGRFLELYQNMGLDIGFYHPTGKTSLKSFLPRMPKQKTLLVHNTFTSKADVDFAKEEHPDLYWCLCPQANLYIENRLPDTEMLINEGLKITLGTDSLASNQELNILAEMETLQQYKAIGFERLLGWATLNGAEFLGMENTLGSIEAGKSPGLNLIQLDDNFKILSTRVKKLI